MEPVLLSEKQEGMSSFFQLHLICQLPRHLDAADLAILIHSITSQLDYCNRAALEDNQETMTDSECGSSNSGKGQLLGKYVVHFETTILAASLFLSSIRDAGYDS